MSKKPKLAIANDVLLITDRSAQQAIWMGWSPSMRQALYGKLSGGKSLNSVGASLAECFRCRFNGAFERSHGPRRTRYVNQLAELLKGFEPTLVYASARNEHGPIQPGLFISRGTTPLALPLEELAAQLKELFANISDRSEAEIFWSIGTSFPTERYPDFSAVHFAIDTLAQKTRLNRRIAEVEESQVPVKPKAHRL